MGPMCMRVCGLLVRMSVFSPVEGEFVSQPLYSLLYLEVSELCDNLPRQQRTMSEIKDNELSEMSKETTSELYHNLVHRLLGIATGNSCVAWQQLSRR